MFRGKSEYVVPKILDIEIRINFHSPVAGEKACKSDGGRGGERERESDGEREVGGKEKIRFHLRRKWIKTHFCAVAARC